jgi:hypothetical protein
MNSEQLNRHTRTLVRDIRAAFREHAALLDAARAALDLLSGLGESMSQSKCESSGARWA